MEPAAGPGSQETHHHMRVTKTDGCFCPLIPAANLFFTGRSRQTPALRLAVHPAPSGWRPAALGAPMERVAAALSGVSRCQDLGWLLVLPCRPGLPCSPFCLRLLLPLGTQATGTPLGPTAQTAPRPPGGHRNAAAGRIILSSRRGFVRV